MKKILIAALMFWSAPAFAEIKDGLQEPYDAPAIEGIAGWINSEPLGTEQLKGKVLLVDFWAYSCVNCVRTLPYLAEWDKKYRDKGLVIIGVHAPEFEFEKEKANVERAVKKWHVPYPVALDNDMKTWGNFKNQYWPAHYLISKEGKVVYTHFGEGKYEVTENNIRTLLGLDEMKEAGKRIDQPDNQTPETYLGAARADRFSGTKSELNKGSITVYTLPLTLELHRWALDGAWDVNDERIMAIKDSVLRLHFYAKNVYLVLGSRTGKPVKASLMLDGKPIGALSGKDVVDNVVTVESHSLYGLVKQSKPAEHVLEIKADAGLEAYAFTFGE